MSRAEIDTRMAQYRTKQVKRVAYGNDVDFGAYIGNGGYSG